MARVSDSITREALAEFLGTLVLMTLGLGVVAQVVLGGGKFGDYLSINLVWGLAAYVVAQMAGAFVASAVVYATYHEALSAFDGGTRQVLGPQGTAGIWATYPQPWLSTWGGFIDQVVGTALLVGVIFAISDRRNAPPPAGLEPLIVGLLVLAIGASFGANAGYAINPARDFGPRLFTALAGWGGEVFRAGNGWWWVPIVAPLLGGVLGGWIYDLCVGSRFPRQEQA